MRARRIARVALAAVGAFGMRGNAQTRPTATVVVNVPAFRVDVFMDGVLARSFRATVGTARHPTPAGEFVIGAIEWNPWWIPPSTAWAAESTKTPPGPRNPMGRVKMRFKGDYFIHATSRITSLGRAASHGCVRLAEQDAVALARMLHAAGAPRALADTDTFPRSRITTTIPLSPPVSVSIRYEPVELRDDSLFVYRDIYRRRSQPLETLVFRTVSVAGIDTAAVNRVALAAFLRGAAGGAAVRLRDLLQ